MDENFSASAYIKNILRRKDILISLFVLLVGILFSIYLFQEQQKRIKNIKSEISQEDEKIILAKELSGLDNRITKVSSPYLDAGFLTKEKFNEFASSANIDSISVEQQEEVSKDFYRVIPFTLNFKANYHNLGKFISTLESQNAIIRIEELVIRKEENIEESPDKTDRKNMLDVQMKVSLTSIKPE